MITIIHGEDITKSRNYFIEQKSQYKDGISLQGPTMNLPDMMQVFEGNELFATEKYVFIEEFFSKRKKSKETEQIIDVITKNQDNAIIYFWESKPITATQTKQFAKAIVNQFKLPPTLFTFLDAVKPNNGKMLVQLFHQALIEQDSQFLFVMLTRQFRLLLALSEQLENAIDEIKRMAPWQKGKLQKQADSFGKDYLLTVYDRIFQIEYGMKTGNLSISLEQAIDFFLVQL